MRAERASFEASRRATVVGLIASALLAATGCTRSDAARAGLSIDSSVQLLPPQGQTRAVDFTTDEGTWMSIDVARDGRWLVFDMLAQVYRLPIEGGEAVALTANSGPALNFHPAISPDGGRIAFISDRAGQNNVWLMTADGANPTPVFLDRETRFLHPAWAPDGKSLVAVRLYPTPGRGWHRQTSELWRLPIGGGEPTRLLAGRLTHFDAPSFSPDGRSLFFHVSYSTGDGLGLLTAGHRVQRLELATGRVENVRTREPTALTPGFVDALRRTAYSADNAIDPPAAVAPVVAPDGRSVAFALEQPGKAMSYRGHEYAPRTALVVRDLATGKERTVLDPSAKDLTMVNAQYGYGVFPRFAWMPDGKSIVAWEGGRIRRLDVGSGAAAVIPFSARVQRVLAESPRSRIAIDDSALAVKFIQWPVASPDGQRVAFVSAGRVWIVDLAGCDAAGTSSRTSGSCTPRPLTRDMTPAVQLTPAWSPDGRRIAFTTWHDFERGQMWVVPDTGGEPRRVATPGAELIFPTWTPNGDALVVSRGPGSAGGDRWHGWNATSGWTAVRVPLSGGQGTPIATLNGPHPTAFAADGRLSHHYQDRALEAPGLLYYPFPTEEALSLAVRVRSIDAGGGSARDHARLPAGRGRATEPVRSPTGRWVAFHAGRFIFVSPLPPGGGDGGASSINTNPNDSVPGRVRVGDVGGIYHSWRDSTTLQFASGNRYVTYDAATGKVHATTIDLRIARPLPRGSIALINAKIVTVDSGRVIDRGTVLVRGSRIACVGTTAACDTAGVDRVLDLSGKVVIPGLVDVHAHHTTEQSGVITPHRPSSALDLAYGVTTILDPAASSESAFPLAEMTDAGVVLGPRTYSTAELLIHPGTAWGDQRIIRTQADADREVDRRADWGATSIKNFRQSARYQQQLIMQAARRRGITVTGEGGPLYFDVGVVLDGQTGWEHLIANLPIYRDAATFFGRAGVVYSPTAIVAGHVLGSMQFYRPGQRLDADVKYQRFMPAADLRRRLAGAHELPKSTFSFPIIAEGLADIVRAGGRGALGEHGEQFGIGTHWEMWAYAEALEPLEVLELATIDGAWFLGLDREIGSITKGKLADLVVLNADPLRDIRSTADIAYVMKGGRLYDDETLAELWPTQRPYLPAPWR